MALRKCPRCELNYARGDAPYCDICAAELKRSPNRAEAEKEPEEPVLCSECGEAPALEGYDLCEDCLREQRRQRDLEFAFDTEDEEPLEEEEDGE